jgi:hypothetical protein
MNRLTQTTIVLIVFCLASESTAMLQSNPDGKVQTFAISGTASIAGVTMKGLPGDPITNNHGYYMAVVNYGWSGTVTPTKEGYSFEPPHLRYAKVASDLNDDYQAKILKYTISGQVGMPGVEMTGLPGNPVTDEKGLYSTTIEYGWKGRVEPKKEGYRFEPRSKLYSVVKTDLHDQNYIAEPAPPAQLQYGGQGWQPPQVSTGSRRSRRVARATGFQAVDSRRVLVVPSAEVNPKDLAEIIEDMQVMSHILDERFKETRRVQGVFTDFGDFFGRDNRQTEATYLQGYGVLFSMEVNFAFSPPPKQQKQQAEQTDEQVDSTWEKAKQQVFSPGDPRGAEDTDSAEEYNSQMVEELKRDLITTLKHAANIRGVQPDEWVILTVIGGGRQGGGGFGGGGFMMGGMGGMYGGSTYGGTSSGGMGGFGGYGGGMAGGSGGMMGRGMSGGMGGFGGGIGGPGGAGVSQATVLTIRAKKSDIDAFAKDEKIFEQFRRKVQIFTY